MRNGEPQAQQDPQDLQSQQVVPRIIPVYIAGPGLSEPAVAADPVKTPGALLSQWLHPYWEKIKGNREDSDYDPNTVNRAKAIAKGVAAKIYRMLNLREQQEIVIYVDQRGQGPGAGNRKIFPVKSLH